jgi:hypothetical protein
MLKRLLERLKGGAPAIYEPRMPEVDQPANLAEIFDRATYQLQPLRR